ncbi:aldose 1-epimerase [Planomonospora parontospora subsp. parontospora]|uniref:Aldose 1-epimerase n=2 Tax=Planomonospora parontospora TaxID=58119 RepID=A0AA37F381_9ACTN|nr:aldose epimerase family protein [Planomonospora parontospora]GGK57585.1 aldose 1-epimerase [Planomonospora parontospora]GII07786.1 aldose 1-epimerase [Planomonospora parontospora subsp. parontospora]
MHFGTTPSGEPVERHVLSSGRMRAAVLSYGAVVQSLEVSGVDVVLGCGTLEDYLTRSRYFGAVVGRYGNRIAGGRFTLDGAAHELPVNDGPNSLHGGPGGFSSRVWRVADASPSAVTLEYVSPDGEEGYPGTLTASVTYTLTDDALVLDYRATTDAPTVLNLTNHSYFNLAGAGSGDVLGHVVRIDADHYLPVDSTKIPTGELAPVAGTPFDFTTPRAIGERIDDPALGGGYDHCYVLRGDIEVREPVSGRVMRVTTTEPGVQFYSGNMLDGVVTDYGRHAGLCLETQRFPDSPNRPEFPSTVLRPGEEFTSGTVYRFG